MGRNRIRYPCHMDVFPYRRRKNRHGSSRTSSGTATRFCPDSGLCGRQGLEDEFTWRLATESCKLTTTSQQARSSCKPSQSICTCLTYIREDMQAKPRYDRSTCIYMHHMQASRTSIYVHDHASGYSTLIKLRQASKSSESDEHVTCTAAPTPVETFNIMRQPPRPSREHLIS